MNNQTLFQKAKLAYATLQDDKASLEEICEELGARVGKKKAEIMTLVKADAICFDAPKLNMQLKLFDEKLPEMKAVK